MQNFCEVVTIKSSKNHKSFGYFFLQLAREVLDEGVKVADIGVATDEIDRVVHEAAIERECYPSPLNYHGFPKSCCTSVNEVICHGIPDMRPLQNGDICNSKYLTVLQYCLHHV